MAKNTPNLPASSRMQMPSGGGKMNSKMNAGSKGTTKKVMAAAKGGKMSKKAC